MRLFLCMATLLVLYLTFPDPEFSESMERFFRVGIILGLFLAVLQDFRETDRGKRDE